MNAGTDARGYGAEHRRRRARILAGHPPCVYCGSPATTIDHVPAIAELVLANPGLSRRDAAQLADAVPACTPCNSRRGGHLGARARAARARARRPVPVTLPEPTSGTSRRW